MVFDYELFNLNKNVHFFNYIQGLRYKQCVPFVSSNK